MSITKEQALERAKALADKVYRVTDEMPDNCHVYGAPTDCWYALCSSGQQMMLTSSRLICICKATGEVLYDGSAGDEG